MRHHYHDITDTMGEPKWWDEHAVPRYCEFSVYATADIYCRECCLLLIECQSCRRTFRVCMSAGDFAFAPGGQVVDTRGALAKAVATGSLHYGDPPNYECCPAGPTMSSVPRRVLEFWGRSGSKPWEWERKPDLEKAIDCEWAE